MYKGKLVFSQTLDFLPRKQFRKCVNRYNGNYRTRSFTCYEQFLCMAFAQLSYRDSLRDTVLCLRALHNKLHHAGIQSKVSRSTLADANEKRDWRIYCDFTQTLIVKARGRLGTGAFGDAGAFGDVYVFMLFDDAPPLQSLPYSTRNA